ncbi:hypothetical protein Dsin_032056 [Dipteronia sinensis]|uniref:Uncharacterized protein n=1 Tax=Dipteronia sinensis TaxID=43782 RepID=A0AAD9ZNJ1_9ROSI|nr:hypothetical protein Dsin_032056 [Dipteronia sinensis]
MDFAHTADNIFAIIISVLEIYGITHRILSITLDNASANTKSIALFTERNIPQAGGCFFHQRCACHIINLFVQSGLKEVFYNATVTLSGVYYPTSSQAIHQIVEMSDLLNTYREDDLLGHAVVAMETKFKKYWFGGVDTEPSPEPDTQPLPTSWSILKRQKKDKSASSSSSTTRSAASSDAN